MESQTQKIGELTMEIEKLNKVIETMQIEHTKSNNLIFSERDNLKRENKELKRQLGALQVFKDKIIKELDKLQIKLRGKEE